MSSELTTLADRYVLDAPIAKGGMASVWRARDDVLARSVAIKILHPELAEVAGFLERFRFEALAAARLTHPNVVAIYDTGSEQGEGAERHFIVMEYCAGGSLGDHLAREGPFEPDRAAAVGADVCEALAYSHRSGVIHRDVKPANVLVTAEGTLKVADFGIAKAAFSIGDITTTGSLLGTVTYLSPEQLNGDEPDARSDLYSVGVMLYELLAGRPPFAAETQMATAMKHLREEPPPLRSVRAGIPRRLEAMISKALAKDPAARFGSAEEMRDALLGTSAATTAVLSTLRPVERRREQTPRTVTAPDRAGRPLTWVLVLIAAAVVAAVALTVLAGTLGDGQEGGREGTGSGGAAAAQTIAIRGAEDFDPVDDEHDELVAQAYDGSKATVWHTSNYSDSFEAIGKAGVGLVFDLGESKEVAEVEVSGCTGCALEVRSSDQTSSSEVEAFEPVAQSGSAGATETFSFAPQPARYWLVLITSLPGGGSGSAEISEVRFRGP